MICCRSRPRSTSTPCFRKRGKAVTLSDADYMDKALSLASRGRGRTSPNPLVGSLVVAHGVVVGAGFHRRAGEPHAEVHALRSAGDRAKGATLFSSLEPCCHVGRTGPCVARIVEAGIARVVVGVEDPYPLVAGGGIRYLRERGIQVDVGVRQREATRMNEAFFTYVRHHRPFVTMKVAVSADGRIAAAPGRRSALTASKANRRVHALRAEVDAIGVGSGTMLVDDPALTAREVYRDAPLTRVVFDTRLRTPATARVFSTLEHGPVIVFTTDAAAAAAPGAVEALTSAGATVERLASRDLSDALRHLGARGVTSLLLEGGATIHRAAWTAALVDRVQLYISPLTVGADGVPWIDAPTLSLGMLRDVRVEPCGRDTFIEGYVYRAD